MPLLTAWGNSTGCRIPIAVLDVVGWKAGDFVQIIARPDGVVEIRGKQVPGCAMASPHTDLSVPRDEPSQW